MTEEREYDVVIFGASGFTGQYVVDELAKTVDEEGLRWAIAGRSMSRLIQTLRNACDRTGKDLSKINVIRADVSNPESLENMASQTRVLLNCVGPFRFYGEPVVRACIAQGTHHLDLSGEAGFLDATYLEYDDQAREGDTYVIGSCGWDTIPADLGVLHMQKNFTGDLAWVESYVSINKGKSGAMLNFGTFQSAIHGVSHFFSDLKLHKQIMERNSPPKAAYGVPWRFPVFYGSAVKNWCMLLPDSEKCIVERTQKYYYEQKRQRPVQFNSYFCPGSIFRMLFFMVVGSMFGFLAQFKCGRNLMEKWPRLLSGGLFKKGGPKPEQVAASSFSMTFSGKGWRNTLSNPAEQHKQAPDVTVKTRVEGPELAYVTTPICLVQAAYTLLKEKDRIPKQGGVYTPGAVFGNTSLIERLQQRGLNFSVIAN